MPRFRITRTDVIETDTITYRDQPLTADVLAVLLKAEADDARDSGMELIDPIFPDETVCEYTTNNEKLVVEEI